MNFFRNTFFFSLLSSFFICFSSLVIYFKLNMPNVIPINFIDLILLSIQLFFPLTFFIYVIGKKLNNKYYLNLFCLTFFLSIVSYYYFGGQEPFKSMGIIHEKATTNFYVGNRRYTVFEDIEILWLRKNERVVKTKDLVFHLKDRERKAFQGNKEIDVSDRIRHIDIGKKRPISY